MATLSVTHSDFPNYIENASPVELNRVRETLNKVICNKSWSAESCRLAKEWMRMIDEKEGRVQPVKV